MNPLSRPALKLKILLYEQRFYYPDSRQLYGFCAWCGWAGGDGMRPFLLPRLHHNWGALDMHEWYFKRNRNLPDHITFSIRNMVLLHRICHSRHGQTKVMTAKCYHHKKQFYDLQAWVDGIANQGKNLELLYKGK